MQYSYGLQLLFNQYYFLNMTTFDDVTSPMYYSISTYGLKYYMHWITLFSERLQGIINFKLCRADRFLNKLL
jgi:hypothetical protein